MPCTNCVPELEFLDNCLLKLAGGAERTLYYLPMCKIAPDGFIEGYASGIITDITVLDGAVFLPIAAIKDSIKADYVHDPMSRMVDLTLTFDIQSLGADTDRILAAAQWREFLQGFIDYNEPVCFVVEERKSSRNITTRKLYPNLAAEPFNGTSGAKSEESPKTTLMFKRRVEQLPFILDSAYVLPLA